MSSPAPKFNPASIENIRRLSPSGIKTGAMIPTTVFIKNMTSAPVIEISRKNERFSGTLISSVDFSLFPTRFATNPETKDKTPVG